MLSHKLSEKRSETFIFGVITLMYVTMCMETDIYVPAFPKMVQYFATTENKIQLILSLNLIGLCIASFISGPLSDTYGRKKILLVGLTSFLISSLGSLFADNFQTMLFWRIIQGTSASVPMVIGSAIILDKYPLEKASQLIGISNSIITATMASAPILGTWLTHQFHWRANFILITVLVGLALMGTLLYIEETLPPNNRKSFSLSHSVKNYFLLIKNFRFMGYAIIALLPFSAIIVFISNLSLIFVNHIGVSIEDYGYFQATTMCAYMIFSGLSATFISKIGVSFTKNFGNVLILLGGTSLFVIALLNPNSPVLICTAMAIFAAGGALVLGIYVIKAFEAFPEIKGTTSSMMTVIRQLLAASLIFISEIFYNGTIVPIAIIIFSYMIIAIIWYIALQRLKFQASKT